MQFSIYRLKSSVAITINAVSICISIYVTKLTVLVDSARYLTHWGQDGLGISPAVEGEELCKYVSCMLPTIDTKKSLLSKELYTFCILFHRQCYQDFA